MFARQTLTGKQIISRVREVHPHAAEAYMLQLISDAVTDLGKYNVKYDSAKTNIVADKMWYTLNDADSGIEVSKVFKVSIMDDAGDYKMIPRLVINETATEDLV